MAKDSNIALTVHQMFGNEPKLVWREFFETMPDEDKEEFMYKLHALLTVDILVLGVRIRGEKNNG